MRTIGHIHVTNIEVLSIMKHFLPPYPNIMPPDKIAEIAMCVTTMINGRRSMYSMFSIVALSQQTLEDLHLCYSSTKYFEHSKI